MPNSARDRKGLQEKRSSQNPLEKQLPDFQLRSNRAVKSRDKGSRCDLLHVNVDLRDTARKPPHPQDEETLSQKRARIDLEGPALPKWTATVFEGPRCQSFADGEITRVCQLGRSSSIGGEQQDHGFSGHGFAKLRNQLQGQHRPEV